MRIYEIILEGYKEAIAEFSKANDPSLVANVTNAFKQLVNKNQVSGDEKNIDWWRKQGWDAFFRFVDTKSRQPTATQTKRSKIPGKSITLDENNQWLIVVPLDKDASCFHGRNTDWCTTKPHQHHFEQYFYDKDVVLIYFLNKINGKKWAIATHKKLKEVEYFDENDTSLNAAQFTSQTGIDPTSYITAVHQTHGQQIDTSKIDYKNALIRLDELMVSFMGRTRDPEIERLLLFTKNGERSNKYLSKLLSKLKSIVLSDKGITTIASTAIGYDANTIRYIKNPSKELQLAAVNQDGLAIGYIENPSEAVQLAAINQDGLAIGYIKNPSEELQLAAVNQNGRAIGYIENPSEAVQLAAVNQDGRAIEYIENPSEAVQLAAVKQNGRAIRYIKNPSEAVQLAAINQDGLAIGYIKNPSEELQLAAINQDGRAIGYIKNPSEAVQLAAVKQNGLAIGYIENPTPKVKALAAQLKAQR